MQVLEQRSLDDSVSGEMHDIIRRQSLHMTKLIDDLLDISRIVSGKILLQMERLDLAALTRNVLADHQHHFDANQLTLISTRPPRRSGWSAMPLDFRQVITNLLHNATKFTDPGGTIEVSSFAVGNPWYSACGIPVSDRTDGVACGLRTFPSGRFPSGPEQGGLGLGLALSKRLLEKHGGSITAASEGLGCGSTVQHRNAAGSRSAGNALTAEQTKSLRRQRRHRILIVDDSRDTILTLTVLLKQMGQEVAQANNGAQCSTSRHQFFAPRSYCAISACPTWTGMQWCRAMRADPALKGAHSRGRSPAMASRKIETAPLKAGFDRHLTKPISHDQLRGLLLEIP